MTTTSTNDPRLAVAFRVLESVCSEGNADPAQLARELIAALDAVDPIRTTARSGKRTMPDDKIDNTCPSWDWTEQRCTNYRCECGRKTAVALQYALLPDNSRLLPPALRQQMERALAGLFRTAGDGSS